MKPFPPVLLAISMLLVYLLSRAATQTNLGPVYDNIVLFYSGWLLVAFGVVSVIAMVRKFKKNETTVLPNGMPSRLMTDGIYAYSRNPIYVFMVIALLGVVMINGALIGLTVVPVFIALVQTLWISFEEAQLEKAFGQEYLDYKGKVRSWV
ncbi:MAG: methyltransferase family protein [Parvibaculales bacterium]